MQKTHNLAICCPWWQKKVKLTTFKENLYTIAKVHRSRNIASWIKSESYKFAFLKKFEGSINLLEHMSIEPSRLKYMVSSPGGVTIRGLYELEKDGVKGAIMSAIYEAYLKSKQLWTNRLCHLSEMSYTVLAYKYIYHLVTSHFNIKKKKKKR